MFRTLCSSGKSCGVGKGRCCESNIRLSHPFSGPGPAARCVLPSSLSLLNTDLDRTF